MKLNNLSFFAVLLTFSALVQAEPAGEHIPVQATVSNNAAGRTITLANALRMTLARHPQIQVQSAAVEIADGTRRQASGVFDENIAVNALSGVMPAPEYVTGAEGAETLHDFRQHTDSFKLGITRRTRTGATLNPGVTVTRNFSEDSGQVDQYSSKIGFTLTIPLLRGRGEAASAAERSYYAQAEAQRAVLESVAAQQVLETLKAYWQCVSAGVQLDIQRGIEDNARELVELTRAMIAGYVQSSNELAYTQAYLNQNTAQRLQAEALRSQRLAALCTAMGLEAHHSSPDPWILPGDTLPELPRALAFTNNLPRILCGIALEKRPDLIAARKQLEAAGILYKAARNGLLPQVDLQLFAGYAGAATGGGVPSGAESLAHELTGPGATAALSLSLPIRNTSARGSLLTARGQMEQARAQTRLLVNQIVAAVRSDIENVKLYLAACTSQSESVEFYKQTLNDREVLYKSGQGTLINLIDANNDLGSAQLLLVSTKVTALIYLAQVKYNTGTLVVTTDGQNFTIDTEKLTRLPSDWSEIKTEAKDGGQ